MEFMLGILVGIAVGFMFRNKQKSNDDVRAIIRQEIEHNAQREKNEAIAEGMRKAALQIGNPLSFNSPSIESKRVEKETAVADTPAWSRDVSGLDSVSVLLYFGAFLMVSGVGLFVGLSDFSGNVKTTAVLLLALVLYAAGLAMHRFVERLHPVALTLTAVGLICLPFTGVAAYFYAPGMANGPFIWCTTSLGSLLLYVFALWRIRQSLIGYLSVFMCISLWLSIVPVIDAPVYYFGWAAIALGMVYLLVSKSLKLWLEVEAPLSVSATVMVPAALVLTFLFGFGTISLTNLGITALLGAFFYALATWLEKNETTRLIYFSLSYALLPVAVLLLVQNVVHSTLAFGWALSVTAIVEFVVASAWRKSHDSWYQAALAMSAVTFGIASLIAPPYFQQGGWAHYCGLLGFNMVAQGVIACVSRYRLHALMSLLALVILPALIGYFVVVPNLPVLTMSGIYLALATLLMVTKSRARTFGFYDLTVLAYSLALIAAWSIGATGTTWIPMVTTICVGLMVAIAALYEKMPVVLYGSTVLGMIALVQWFTWHQSDKSWVVALTFGGLSLAYYIGSKLLSKHDAYARPFLVSGLAGMYLAAMAGVAMTQISWTTIMLLALAGALTSFESYIQKQRTGTYIGSGVVLVALQMALYLQHIREAEIYWHMWSLYFACLAWIAHRDKRLDEKQTFTIFALALQTLPLAWQALNGDTNLGFTLLAESIALMLFGLWAHYRLVAWWGLAVAVGSVLYQLREFQFFVLVLLGAGIIGLGVYLLLRREKKN